MANPFLVRWKMPPESNDAYGAAHHFGGCVSASPVMLVNFGVSRNERGRRQPLECKAEAAADL
jgi:hypothetical protein